MALLQSQKAERLLRELAAITPETISSASITLTNLQSVISKLQELTQREMDLEKRQDLKLKIDSYQIQYQDKMKQVDQLKRQIENERREKERNELFSQPATSLPMASSSSGYSSPGTVHQQPYKNPNEKISESLNRSIRYVDEYLEMGTGSLQKLREQGLTLKNAQRRILDVANTLGLSQSTIRWIERRTSEDQYIFWSGVVVTLIVMALVFYYWL